MVWVTYQLPISSSLGLDQQNCKLEKFSLTDWFLTQSPPRLVVIRVPHQPALTVLLKTLIQSLQAVNASGDLKPSTNIIRPVPTFVRFLIVDIRFQHKTKTELTSHRSQPSRTPVRHLLNFLSDLKKCDLLRILYKATLL